MTRTKSNSELPKVSYPPVSFGSSLETEVRLAALILAGRKRATAWNGKSPNDTAPGMRWTVYAAGLAVGVIETISVEQRLFSEIDEAFAFEEGEGDRSLAFWRAVHEDFFRSQRTYSFNMPLWCERFRLVTVLDEELAQQAAAHVEAEEREAAAIMAKCMAHARGS